MRIEVFGNDQHGFSATGESTPEDVARLAPCPFCGGRDLEIANTHTPHYWVRCEGCGAEKHDNSDPPDGSAVRDARKSREATKAAHEAAVERAVAGWNTRAGAAGGDR